MSHEAIYRQPVPGNLHEEKAFSFECSHIFLNDRKTLFEKLLLCYENGPVSCTASKLPGKNCLVWQGLTIRGLNVLTDRGHSHFTFVYKPNGDTPIKKKNPNNGRTREVFDLCVHMKQCPILHGVDMGFFFFFLGRRLLCKHFTAQPTMLGRGQGYLWLFHNPKD